MARIRTIKPTLWGDEKVARLSRDARLLFLGLISSADDQGRFLASPQVILGYVYPHDDIPPAKVKKWLEEIADVGLVELYQPNGLQYGALPHWKKHQRISHPQPSAIPPPPSRNGDAADVS
jgi:hypothetical protein